MELKVLGSVSPYCKDNKNCPGYLITKENSKVLLDCGSGITRLLNFPEDLNNLHIFISHYHKDHYLDLFSIAYASYVYYKFGNLKNRIKLFIPKIAASNEQYDYLLIKYLKEKYFDTIKYDVNSSFEINGLNITFNENKHGIKCYSTKMSDEKNTLVYTSDTGYANVDSLIKFSMNSNLLIVDSTLLKSDNQFNENHLHAFEAATIAREANVDKLLLTHFWPEYDSEEYVNEAKEIFPNVEAAREGMILKLDK